MKIENMEWKNFKRVILLVDNTSLVDCGKFIEDLRGYLMHETNDQIFAFQMDDGAIMWNREIEELQVWKILLQSLFPEMLTGIDKEIIRLLCYNIELFAIRLENKKGGKI